MASAACSSKPAARIGLTWAASCASRSKLSIRRICACFDPVAAVGVFVDKLFDVRAGLFEALVALVDPGLVDAVVRLLQCGVANQVREHTKGQRHAGGLGGPVG